MPKLNNRGGDLDKRWYIEYYLWNEAEERLERQQQFVPSTLKTAKQRRSWATSAITEITDLMRQGYIYTTEKEKKESKKKGSDVEKSDSSEERLSVDSTTTKESTIVTVETKQNDQILQPIVKDIIDSIVTFKEKTTRDRTGETYRNTYNRFVEFLTYAKLLDITFEKISPKLFYDFSDYIIVQKGLSNRYRNNLVNDLKGIFNEIVEREIIEKSPLKKVPSLTVDPSRKNIAFTDEQILELEKYLIKNDERLYFFTRFIYQGFIRPKELVQLQVRDIQLQNNRIAIPGHIGKGGARKGLKVEYVRITPRLLETIHKMKLDSHMPTDYIFGKKLETCSSPTIRNRVSERHQEALKAAALYNGELTLYSWKHTGVVKAWKAGASIEWLREHLRHSDLKDTVIYLKSLGLMLERDQEAPGW